MMSFNRGGPEDVEFIGFRGSGTLLGDINQPAARERG